MREKAAENAAHHANGLHVGLMPFSRHARSESIPDRWHPPQPFWTSGRTQESGGSKEGTVKHPIWLIAVLALELAAVVAEAAAQESQVEQWTCGAVGCGVLFSLDDSACNRLLLTADIANGTGTVQFDNLPMQNADFWVDGFSRTWAWSVGDRAYYFEIGHDYGGSYFPRGPLGPIHRFSCRKSG